jgi:hypothetical protein
MISKPSIWNNRNLQSEQLLKTAKSAVEIVIEQDEETALRFIEAATASYTNCYSKCLIANFEFTMVNADRPIKRQIERSENMRHFIGQSVLVIG